MKDAWQEIDMDEYRKLIAESKDDKEFRRKLKELQPKTPVKAPKAGK